MAERISLPIEACSREKSSSGTGKPAGFNRRPAARSSSAGMGVAAGEILGEKVTPVSLRPALLVCPAVRLLLVSRLDATMACKPEA